mgnify:CR=1 FL=1
MLRVDAQLWGIIWYPTLRGIPFFNFCILRGNTWFDGTEVISRYFFIILERLIRYNFLSPFEQPHMYMVWNWEVNISWKHENRGMIVNNISYRKKSTLLTTIFTPRHCLQVINYWRNGVHSQKLHVIFQRSMSVACCSIAHIIMRNAISTNGKACAHKLRPTIYFPGKFKLSSWVIVPQFFLQNTVKLIYSNWSNQLLCAWNVQQDIMSWGSMEKHTPRYILKCSCKDSLNGRIPAFQPESMS